MAKGIRVRNLPTDTIIHLYTVEHLPFCLIAKRFKVGSATIRKLLCDNNIPIGRSCKINIDVTELNHLYTIEHLPSTEIAKRFGITFPTVLRQLRNASIPIRDSHHNEFKTTSINTNNLHPNIKTIIRIGGKRYGSASCSICGKTKIVKLMSANSKVPFTGICRKCCQVSRRLNLDISIIKHLYLDEHLTTNQIAQRFNVSPHVITKNIKSNGIPIRTKGDTHILLFRDKIKNNGTLKSPSIGDMRQGFELGLKNPSYYVWVQCSECKSLRWEVKSRIKKHPLCQPCAMIRNGLNHRGDRASAWLGGISFEPYTPEFNNTLKEQIRKRDNYTCQMCGKPQNGKRLAIHHIDYNKKHNVPNNLISLCHNQGLLNCHSKTNHNREYWTNYFTELLKKRAIVESLS